MLLVEDDELHGELMRDLLGLGGHEVIHVNRGEMVVDAARTGNPDIILLDLSLPDIGGLEVARILKADPSTANIPLVAVTAHALSQDRTAALGAGCVGYFAKPIDPATFVAFMERFLAEP